MGEWRRDLLVLLEEEEGREEEEVPTPTEGERREREGKGEEEREVDKAVRSETIRSALPSLGMKTPLKGATNDFFSKEEGKASLIVPYTKWRLSRSGRVPDRKDKYNEPPRSAGVVLVIF